MKLKYNILVYSLEEGKWTITDSPFEFHTHPVEDLLHVVPDPGP